MTRGPPASGRLASIFSTPMSVSLSVPTILRRVLAAIEQPDGDRARPFDHVVVGEDVTVARDDEARPAAMLQLRLVLAAATLTAGRALEARAAAAEDLRLLFGVPGVPTGCIQRTAARLRRRRRYASLRSTSGRAAGIWAHRP